MSKEKIENIRMESIKNELANDVEKLALAEYIMKDLKERIEKNKKNLVEIALQVGKPKIILLESSFKQNTEKEI